MVIVKINLLEKLKDWFYTKSEVDNKLQSLSSDAVNVVLSLDKYNCNVGDTVTVTVTVTGSDGVGLSDYKVNLYCNGTSLSNGLTNTNGVYTYTYTCTGFGLVTFTVNNNGVSVQCMVDRKMQLITSTSKYQLYSDGLNHMLKISIPTQTWNVGWTTVDTIPSAYKDYYPLGSYMFITLVNNLYLNINEKGQIRIGNTSSASLNRTIFNVVHYV